MGSGDGKKSSPWPGIIGATSAVAVILYSRNQNSAGTEAPVAIAAPSQAKPAVVSAPEADSLPQDQPYTAPGISRDGFVFEPTGECTKFCDFRLSGPIIPGVAAAIQAQLQPITGRRVGIFLDSPGGSMEEAMLLGRVLRTHEASTYVGSGREWSSACVLLLASGVMRRVHEGRIGIHSPYMEVATETATFQQQHDRLGEQVRGYLAQMNITAELYDRMRTVPSEGMLYLDDAELTRLGLQGSDPVWTDYRDSQNAARAKMSKTDYLAR